MKKNCVVLGAGLIGQQFVRMLDDHEDFNLIAIVASDKSAGQKLKERWSLPDFDVPATFADMKLLTKIELDNILDNFEIVFSALPADLAKDYEKEFANKGKKVFSNASAYRYEKNVPIMIPEINANHLEAVKLQDTYKNKGFIITNSNCSISGLAIVLHSLKKGNVPFTNVFVSTYQALSGAGFKGLTDIPRDRVIPYIDKEEEKMTIESQKILGSLKADEIISDTSYQLLANCARVPIENGHLEAVTLELAKETTLDEVNQALQGLSYKDIQILPSAPEHPIVIMEEKDRPQSALDLYVGEKKHAIGMTVLVGRLRLTGNYLRLFLLVHNTIRGGAGGSVLNAELALRRGYL